MNKVRVKRNASGSGQNYNHNILPESIFADYIRPIGHRYNTHSKVNKKLYISKKYKLC